MSLFINKGIRIACVSCAVPHNMVTVKSFSSVFGEEAVEKFTNSTGIASMYKALPKQTASDLAVSAAENLLRRTGIEKKDIGLMLMVTQSPDYRRPSSASVIQKRLGLSIDCSCMEINLGCSGMIYGIQTAMSLMNNTDIKYSLLLMGDTASKLVDPKDKSIVMMYGDAGAAVILERDDNAETKTLLRSDGDRFKAIILPAGGFRDMNPGHERFICSDGIERSLYDIFMDGTSVFSFSISDVPKALQDYLCWTGTEVSDYDSFIFHQANQFIIKQIMRKMKIPREKVPISLDRYGNTGGVSVPLTICDAFGSEEYASEKRILMCGFGIGLSWGITNVTIDTSSVFPVIETEDYYKEGKMIPGQY